MMKTLLKFALLVVAISAALGKRLDQEAQKQQQQRSLLRKKAHHNLQHKAQSAVTAEQEMDLLNKTVTALKKSYWGWGLDAKCGMPTYLVKDINKKCLDLTKGNWNFNEMEKLTDAVWQINKALEYMAIYSENVLLDEMISENPLQLALGVEKAGCSSTLLATKYFDWMRNSEGVEELAALLLKGLLKSLKDASEVAGGAWKTHFDTDFKFTKLYAAVNGFTATSLIFSKQYKDNRYEVAVLFNDAFKKIQDRLKDPCHERQIYSVPGHFREYQTCLAEELPAAKLFVGNALLQFTTFMQAVEEMLQHKDENKGRMAKVALKLGASAVVAAGGLGAVATGGVTAPIGVAAGFLANQAASHVGSDKGVASARRSILAGMASLVKPPVKLGFKAGLPTFEEEEAPEYGLSRSVDVMLVAAKVLNMFRYCPAKGTVPRDSTNGQELSGAQLKEMKDYPPDVFTSPRMPRILDIGGPSDSKFLSETLPGLVLASDVEQAMYRYFQLQNYLNEYSGGANDGYVMKSLELADALGPAIWGTPGMHVNGEGKFNGLFSMFNG